MRIVGCAIAPLALIVAWAQTVTSPQDSTKDSLYGLRAQAMKAYTDKHYGEAVRLFDAAFSAGLNRDEDAYNAACSAALAGDRVKALEYLNQAARLGYRDADHMQSDADLQSVRSNSEFQRIVERVRQNEVAYRRKHGDPEGAAIVTTDMDLFWSLYDKLLSSSNPAGVLENEYFRKGSPGLQDFIFARITSGTDLWKTMQAAPKYYAALRPATLRIHDFVPQIRTSFHKMKELYADSTFPDVYFLIGRMNSGGTTGPAGLLIGADMFGKTPSVPLDELSEWHRKVVGSVESIPSIVAHELIHYQQKTEGKTLLAAAIHEGSADFVGELISGVDDHFNHEARTYGLQHEPELWAQFSQEMHGTNTSHWMYEGKVVNGRPADLAYFVGYRISEAYYNQAADKKKAIVEILQCTDADKLLSVSGYQASTKKK